MSTIRRQINIDTSPRTLWRALTEPEALGWLGTDGRVDGREGGRYQVRVTDMAGAAALESGMIHAFKPTGRLEVIWDRHSEGPWRGTRTLFQVARDGKESVVHVQHLSPAFTDAAVRAPVDEFWRLALLRLRDRMEA